MIRSPKAGCFWLICLLIGGAPSVASALSLTVAGLANQSSPTASDVGVVYDLRTATGFGAAVFGEVGLSRRWSLELGMIYVTRRYAVRLTEVDTGLTTVDGNIFELPLAMLPVTARYWLTSWLGIGLGFYGATGFDRVKVSDSTGRTSLDQTYAETRLKMQDFGAQAGIRLRIPILGPLGFVSEGRYSYGVSNSAAGGTGEGVFHNQDLLILGGLSVGTVGDSR